METIPESAARRFLLIKDEPKELAPPARHDQQERSLLQIVPLIPDAGPGLAPESHPMSRRPFMLPLAMDPQSNRSREAVMRWTRHARRRVRRRDRLAWKHHHDFSRHHRVAMMSYHDAIKLDRIAMNLPCDAMQLDRIVMMLHRVAILRRRVR
ncbi:MAG TPA: hypothetical protein VK753_02015 [Xanthomonadaceae bacterium]|jgi:hypothetical protein|nr:hypothetical protein [Xanthomonadaceae bacterium]